MTIPRIYLPRPLEIGALCTLGEEDRHYVLSVLRLRTNDHLVLFDGASCEYQAVIREAGGDRLSVEILKKSAVRPRAFRMTLSQALPKAGKMDFIVQKATELGVDRIIPFHSLRSVSRIPAEKHLHKTARWRKIAVEAARQCGRTEVPEIADITGFRQMLGCARPDALRILFWEEETKVGIGEALRASPVSAAEIFMAVGPEGGFSKEEVSQAAAAGFRSVSLGDRILRVETAALAILAIVQYEKGGLGSPGGGGLNHA